MIMATLDPTYTGLGTTPFNPIPKDMLTDVPSTTHTVTPVTPTPSCVGVVSQYPGKHAPTLACLVSVEKT